ncbi:hypothetical protein BT69DRAFT_1277474 [Atractiella rhizophila]|nr:hypothetical protein BT69DRAFT_1277474 [Atractiella rhizophila]
MPLRCLGSIPDALSHSVLYFRYPTSNFAAAFISEDRKVAGGAEDDGCWQGQGQVWGERDAGAREARVVARIIGSGIGRMEVETGAGRRLLLPSNCPLAS